MSNMRKLKCFLRLHTWSQWTYDKGDFNHRRYCKYCGKVKVLPSGIVEAIGI